MSVAWVGAGIAAVGTVSGIMSGNKAQKSADAANANAAAIQQQQQNIANDQYEDYKTTYRPLEQAMVAEARQYGTEADYERAASEAQAASMKQVGLAQERMARTPGLDPSSGAAIAAQRNLALQGAALAAVSQNAARDGVRDKAWARKMDALGLGKGLVTGASSGLASAGASAQRIAAVQQETATSTASGTASMVAGLGNTFLNAYQQSQAAKTPANTGRVDNTLF